LQIVIALPERPRIVHFGRFAGLYRIRRLPTPESDRFIRLPTELLEALLRVPLAGTQWCILFWVIRETLGWNRKTVPFSWYRIAKDLAMDRSGVVRAGSRLLRFGILHSDAGQIGIRQDPKRWNDSRLAPQGEKAMTGVYDDGSQRKAMTGSIASDDASPRKRCQESSLFRRAKDSSKERLKTYKDRRTSADARRHAPYIKNSGRRHLAGAARPMPGKYDSLSQN
jgi:phage replication O-like protein O